jgi:cardiolipin synthase
LPRFSLLVGSGPFWAEARKDIASARRRVLIQAMTFEGDAAGLGVADALAASTARDRRVLVDDYSRHVLNDTFLLFSSDAALLDEAESTWAMFDRLVACGVGVRVTNPIGSNPLNYALRNHKKLLIMDDVAWIGGINFSDHNFEWHDMMLRIDDAEVVDWLAAEFATDWNGKPAAAKAAFPGIDLLSLDGEANEPALEPLLQLFAGARKSIEVVSAYPTFPFVTALAETARRGVPVTLYTPRPNNKPIIRDYLLGIAKSSGLEIRLLADMTHVKAALLDGEALVVGSCNFDFVSYRTNTEYVATIRDSELVADFDARILEPARRLSTPPAPEDYSALRGLRARIGLRVADAVISLLEHGNRVMEWRRP